MMKLAMENNPSETAFVVKEDAGYHLRCLLQVLRWNSAHCQIPAYWLQKLQAMAWRESQK